MRFGPTAISVTSTEECYSLNSVTTRIIVSPWHSWPFSAVQIYFVFRQWPQSVAHFHDYEYNFNYSLIALNCGLHLRSKWKWLIMRMLVFCCISAAHWFQNNAAVLRGLWNVKPQWKIVVMSFVETDVTEDLVVIVIIVICVYIYIYKLSLRP
jgi:hypothetical protein